MSNERTDHEVVIIGSGPAGLTAAIIEGPQPGGQFVFNAEGVD